MGHIVVKKEEWFQKELEDTSPANEAEGQDTTSASRTKLLENRPDSKTSTARELSTDVDVDDVDLAISSFWLHEAWFRKNVWRMKSKLEQHVIPMPPTKS